MGCVGDKVLEGWRQAGFSEEAACAWLAARADVRFTPAVALAWQREGFGPIDAAMWREVYRDPAEARQRRNEGYITPFD